MAEPGGQFVVAIRADASQLKRELAQATTASKTAASQIESVYGGLGNSLRRALAGLAAGISVGAFTHLIKGAIDAQDRLNDLSQATGIAVETLGGIGFAAKQSGTDLEAVSKALGKLNIQIAQAASGDVQAGKAFTALGISLDTLKNASTDEILARIADQFAKYEGGANKSALANELFKKNYQELIPLLNQGGDELRKQVEYFQKFSGVSRDTAARADAFNDTLEKMRLLTGAFANHLASALLPTLQKLADIFVDAKEKGDGFKSSAQGIADVFNVLARAGLVVSYGFQQVGHEIGAVIAQAQALARFDFKAIDAIVDAKAEGSRRRTEELLKNLSDLANVGQGQATAKLPKLPKLQAPSLPSNDTQNAARKILEGQLKALEAVVADEKDVLQSRLHFLQDYYQDDLLSISEYFERRRQVTIDALQVTQKAYDDEIQLLRERQRKTADPKEREDLENKIADVVNKRTRAERDASIASVQSFREEGKAADDFKRKIEDISIRLAELRGDTVTAGLARFDQENQQFRDRLKNEIQFGDERERRVAQLGIRDLDATRERVSQQLQLNKAQDDFALIMGDVEIAQRRIDIAFRSGSITELESLDQLSRANTKRIAELSNVADAYEEIARATQDPRAIQAAEQLRLKIEELAASADLVAKKFADAFKGPVEDALTQFATGAKSLKDIFKDLEKAIVGNISRIASQQITDSLFKKDGPLGGIGGFFGNLFGFGKDKGAVDNGGAALTLAGSTLTTAGASLSAASAQLMAASASLMAAGAASGAAGLASSFLPGLGSNIGGGFFNPFEGMGFFASGGTPPVGKVSVVGERGPELFVPREAGTIIPNDVLMAKRAQRQTVNQTVNINVSGNPNTKTLDQMAVEVGRATRRAMARNS